jgi:hypothetical protein
VEVVVVSYLPAAAEQLLLSLAVEAVRLAGAAAAEQPLSWVAAAAEQPLSWVAAAAEQSLS